MAGRARKNRHTVIATEPRQPSFTVAGVPVTIEVSFFVMGALLGASRANEPVLWAQWVAVSFVSVLLHEMGHALAFRRFGVAPKVVLHGMGGTTSGDLGAMRHTWKDAVVSLAGPAAGFALGGAVLIVQALSPSGNRSLDVLFADLLWVNVGWGAINLLPIEPLDGSHALRSALNPLGVEPAEKICSAISWVTLAVVLVLGFVISMPGLIFLAGWVAISRIGGAMAQRKQRQWQSKLEESARLLSEGNVAGAEVIAREVLTAAPSEWAILVATELQMWCDVRAHDGRWALARLDYFRGRAPLQPELVGAILAKNSAGESVLPKIRALAEANRWSLDTKYVARALVTAAAWSEIVSFVEETKTEELDDQQLNQIEAAVFFAGHYASALALSELRFRRFSSVGAAYNAACSLTRLKRFDEALTWLQRAVDGGYQKRQELEEDDDLAPLRERPEFHQLLSRMK